MGEDGLLWIAAKGAEEVMGDASRLVAAGGGGEIGENASVRVRHPIAATRSRKESSLEIVILRIVESVFGE